MWCSHLGEISSLISFVDILGSTDPRFHQVQDVFINNFVEHGEVGASLCVLIDGHPVIDIAAGHVDSAHRQQWSLDTLVNSFSVGKGVLAIILADLVARNALDLDQEVSRIWPQLSATQESFATVRDVAGHRIGLPAISSAIDSASLYDWQSICVALEHQSPWWEPGTQHGYHVNTFGFLVGEIINRVTSQDPTHLLEAFRDAITHNMYFGVPTKELHRVAELQWSPPQTSNTTPQEITSLDNEIQLKLLTYSNPTNFSGIGAVNSTPWRQAVHPSTNLHASARGVAHMYDILRADAGRIPRSVLADASRTVSFGPDRILDTETHFGAGFQLPTAKRSFGPHSDAVGHYGAGGAVGFYDPTSQLSFGYVMNKMGQGWQNERNQALISSVYACL